MESPLAPQGSNAAGSAATLTLASWDAFYLVFELLELQDIKFVVFEAINILVIG